MDDAGGPNILHLYLTAASGVCETNGDRIPHQTLTLKQYQITWKPEPEELDEGNDSGPEDDVITPGDPKIVGSEYVNECPFITFNADFMSSRAFINGRTEGDPSYAMNYKGLVLHNNMYHYITKVECDIDIEINSDIPNKFKYWLSCNTPSELAKIHSISLIFNYSQT